MVLKVPNHIQNAGILGAPNKFKWNSEIALKFYAAKDQNVRLYDAIDQSNFRAKMAIGIAITEWIIWRFEGCTDLTDAQNRIEAAWASVVHLAYSKSLILKMTKDDKLNIVESVLELALCVLGEAHAWFKNGDIYLAEQIVKQAMLARHIMANKKVFSDWLSETLRLSAQVFPCEDEYDEDIGIYDASDEKPVPREFFFDPSFSYTEEAAFLVLKDFLDTLDPTENPYLNTSEEMKKLGFPGTPYSI